jgi:hypothetical protein
VKLSKSIGKERIEALRCELDEGNNRWPEHIAAMIDEDYRQLMKDFGLRCRAEPGNVAPPVQADPRPSKI